MTACRTRLPTGHARLLVLLPQRIIFAVMSYRGLPSCFAVSRSGEDRWIVHAYYESPSIGRQSYCRCVGLCSQ